MLDTGFEDDVRKIFAAVPKARQTAMCESSRSSVRRLFDLLWSNKPHTLAVSATWPESVQKLADEFMKKPVRITVGSVKLAATRRVEQSKSFPRSTTRSKADGAVARRSRRGSQQRRREGTPPARHPPSPLCARQSQAAPPHRRLCALQEGGGPARAAPPEGWVQGCGFARGHVAGREECKFGGVQESQGQRFGRYWSVNRHTSSATPPLEANCFASGLDR